MSKRSLKFKSNIELTFFAYLVISTTAVGSQTNNNDSSKSFPAHDDAGQSDYMYQLPSIIHFNNPKLLPGGQSFMNEDDTSEIDTTQDDSDPLKLGGLNIRDEARRFSVKLRTLSNEEIGVTAMQVTYSTDKSVRSKILLTNFVTNVLLSTILNSNFFKLTK